MRENISLKLPVACHNMHYKTVEAAVCHLHRLVRSCIEILQRTSRSILEKEWLPNSQMDMTEIYLYIHKRYQLIVIRQYTAKYQKKCGVPRPGCIKRKPWQLKQHSVILSEIANEEILQ